MLAGPERPHGQVEVAGGRLGAGEGGWRTVTGRNLYREAGSGKEWKDAVKRKKKKKKKSGGRWAESRGLKFLFPSKRSQESLFWVFKIQEVA